MSDGEFDMNAEAARPIEMAGVVGALGGVMSSQPAADLQDQAIVATPENPFMANVDQPAPEDLRETQASNSMLGALRAHGPKWAVIIVRQLLLAKLQLRRCNSMGKWVRVRGKVIVRNQGTINIGNRVRFRSEAAISELVTWDGGRIEIGDGTTINYGSSISAAGLVKIGKDCLIGTYVNIMDCTFHNMQDHSWNIEAEPVVIGDRVWLGNRCMIMKGVTIGDGAVVAACSLVTRNVPPNTMVVGVPARVVQHL